MAVGLAFSLVGALTILQSATASVGGLVAINELMPSPIADDAEFLELRNLTAAPVDVGDWCFTEGISACLPPGTSIPADGFLLLVQDETIARAEWGIDPGVPLYPYSGGQKGGGELIRLVDSVGATADEVTYSDQPPWDGGYDAGAVSLERVNPNVASSNPLNWSSALVAPTPGVENSVYDVSSGPLLDVTSLTATPFRPNPSDNIVITAEVTAAVTAQLTYLVNFETPVIEAMTTTDGVVYSATIPGQAAGDLVRYRVDVDDGTETASEPPFGDSINYEGIVVLDPGVDSAVPVIEWFMEDAVYDDLLANHRFDDVTGQAVVSHNGVVWDNVQMRVRGGLSRNFDKASWKVEFPSGHLFDMPGLLHAPVDEFNLQRDQWPYAGSGWDVVNGAGQAEVDYIFVRQQRNGEFHGVGAYVEAMDGRWRDRNEFDDDSYYKVVSSGLNPIVSEEEARTGGYFEKKEGDPNDFTDIYEFTQALGQPTGPDQLDWIFDEFDVPAMINYAAVVEVLRHADSMTHNYRITRDGDTGRWELIHWDLDHAFRRLEATVPGYPYLEQLTTNAVYDRILAYPELEELFHRRVRTLHDELLAGTTVGDQFESLIDSLSDEYLDELVLWPQPAIMLFFELYGETPAEVIGDMHATVADVQATIAANTAPSGPVPPSQPASPVVLINELQYDPIEGSDAEYVELYNPGTEAVDISGWALSDAVDRVFRGGTVIPAGGYIVSLRDDDTFGATYASGIYVSGEHGGKLSNDGEHLALLDDSGTTVDEVTYGIAAPWPLLGAGPSLERIDPLAPADDPTNWAPSTGNGSPGFANTAGPLPTITPVNAAVLEGDVGSVELVMPVRLSEPSTEEITVDWITFGGTNSGFATAGVDFVADSGVVTFAPGETEQTVVITVLGDLEDEPPLIYGEWILVQLSNFSRAHPHDGGSYGLGIGIIGDDD